MDNYKGYELVIGLEVHMQLGTKMKMFCSCENKPFESKPNTYICPVCLGLPGAMPVPNLEAIKFAQKMAYVLSGNLNKSVLFERKNYFYPDLPKGFQITCPHYPISASGEYLLDENPEIRVRFREIHLEEDTGKSMHKDGKSYLDYNKSGVPLLEIVTEPDFHDIDTAVRFCKEVQMIAKFLNVSDADMEKGQMRLEANVSVRKIGDKNLPDYRVELKNINSFGFMKKAVEYELRRQVDALENGEKLYQETRGFNENKNETFVQRSKEEANDYRYFPEPDIPPINFEEAWISEITTSINKTPNSLRKELAEKNIKKEYIEIFIRNLDLLDKFYEVTNKGITSQKAADILINNPKYKTLAASEIVKIEESVKVVVVDENEIRKIIENVLLENPKAVQDYKNGNQNSLQFIIGQVMRVSKGKIDPPKAKDLIIKIIGN